MHENHEGLVTILSVADEEAIGRKLNELMEIVWDTFERRRLLLRSPERRGASRAAATESSDFDLLF